MHIGSLPQTSRQYFFFLTVVHSAMLLGQVMFGAIAWFLQQRGDMGSQDLASLSVLRLVVPGVLIAGLLGNQFLTRTRLPQLQQQARLGDKLLGYRTLLIIRYALLEAPVLLALVTYLLTGEMTVLLVAAAIAAYFASLRPTRAGTIQALQLRDDEQRQVQDPEAVVIPLASSP